MQNGILKRAILDFRCMVLCSESHAKSSIRVLLSLHFGCSNCSSYPQADSHGDHSKTTGGGGGGDLDSSP